MGQPLFRRNRRNRLELYIYIYIFLVEVSWDPRDSTRPFFTACLKLLLLGWLGGGGAVLHESLQSGAGILLNSNSKLAKYCLRSSTHHLFERLGQGLFQRATLRGYNTSPITAQHFRVDECPFLPTHMHHVFSGNPWKLPSNIFASPPNT